MQAITESHLNTQIVDANHFFSVDAILYIDAIEVPDEIARHTGAIKYGGKNYQPIVLSGAPQNLILNLPLVRKIGKYEMIIGFDQSHLPFVIEQGKVFDFSAFYRNPKYSTSGKHGYVYNYMISNKFVLDRYIIPYIR